jgi:hypothetical protein
MGNNYSELISNEFQSESPCAESINRYRKHVSDKDFYKIVVENVKAHNRKLVYYFNAIGELNNKICGEQNLLNLSISYGSFPIFNCILYNNYNIIIKYDSLRLACYNNRKEMLKTLIEKRVEFKNIMISCCVNERVSSEIIRILLQNGADVNHRDDVCGKTPVFYAIHHRDMGILDILIRYGADYSEFNLGDMPNNENGNFMCNRIRELRSSRVAVPVAVSESGRESVEVAISVAVSESVLVPVAVLNTEKSCPMCRKINIFHKIFTDGVELNCCICLNKNANNYSGICGHTVCESCYNDPNFRSLIR